MESPLQRPDLVRIRLKSRASTTHTYRTLARHCETGLRAAFNMIVDLACLNREWRSRFLDLALRLGARHSIVECSAPLEILQARLRQRIAEGLDESDADTAVLEYQLAHFDPLDDEERLLVSLGICVSHNTDASVLI